MKGTIEWIIIVICLAVIVGTTHWTRVQKRIAVRDKDNLDEKASTVTRQRRIIYNDDGGGQYPHVNPRAAEGAAGFLSARFQPCVDTQVDSYFWCVGDGQTPPWGQPTPEAIGDANQVMIEATHGAGMEIFASLRMNDVHDAAEPELIYPLKRERPDLLLGQRDRYPRGSGPKDSVMRRCWAGLDYAKSEVREHKFQFIDALCRQYDFDGLELDFFRHPMFFKYGEIEQNIDTMTDFVRRIRQDLDNIARTRGRPYLLAVHVPITPELSLRIGLDVQRWLADGLIDLLVAGGGYCAGEAPYEQFIELGHRYKVPVYPCINTHAPSLYTKQPGQLFVPTIVERMRAMARNFWAMGGDGVYLFNMFDVRARGNYTPPAHAADCFNELGDPETLTGLDKLYGTDEMPWAFLGYAYNSWPSQLPAPLNLSVPITLRISDPVEAAADSGLLKELLVRARVSGLEESESVALMINGTTVPIINRIATDNEEEYWFEAMPEAPSLQQGINEFVVKPSTGAWGKRETMIQEIQVWVRYK